MKGSVLIIWDRLGDYHRARVEALRARLGFERVMTADLGSADALYQWENSGDSERHVVLSRKPVDEPDLWNRLRAFRKVLREHGIRHLAIAGYGRIEYVLMLVIARLVGCRITLFAESWYGKAALKNRLKGIFLKAFCHRFLVSGTRAREHFEQELRIPGDRILTGYSVVDNDHFARSPEIATEPVLLCVARFSPEKNLARLIRDFQASKLAETHRLRVIGGGPLRPELEQSIADPSRVELMDWLTYTELPAAYARARFFILPSLFEPWGLVVNEAMAAGLPVIVSRACGCQPDLVTPENGFVFDEKDPESLPEILDQLADLEEDRRLEMGQASRRIIAGFSCLTWAQQLERSFD